MGVTVIVEPDPGGHRFQAVANVARVAARSGEVVLLTSTVGAADDAFATLLADLDVELQVTRPFDAIRPPTRQLARAVAAACREREVDKAIVMDADQALKRWWWVARQEFRGLRRRTTAPGPGRRPFMIFMLTRYPAKLTRHDTFGWKLRISKAGLAIAARAFGTLDHVAGFAGRDDMTDGWVVKRARDPEMCLAHSRDRVAIREQFELPRDRRLVGIFGVIEERKNAPMVLDALDHAGLDDVDLVLGGGIWKEVWAWIDALPPQRRRRVITYDGFLTDLEMDQLVAAVDCCPIPLTNNGPSGIMGKALAAEVPVVTAGSTVRAAEIAATDGGLACDLTVPALGEAIREVLSWPPDRPRANTVPPATAEAFAERLLALR